MVCRVIRQSLMAKSNGRIAYAMRPFFVGHA